MSRVKLLIAAATVLTTGVLLYKACKKDKTLPDIFTNGASNFEDNSVVKLGKGQMQLVSGGSKDYTMSWLQQSCLKGVEKTYTDSIKDHGKTYPPIFERGGFEFKEADFPRPLPDINPETNKIEAHTAIYTPTGKGKLSGKTVIINPGHGAYRYYDGTFDAGTPGRIGSRPVEEWQYMTQYGNDLAKRLSKEGAAVIALRGAGMFEAKTLQNLLKGEFGSPAVRQHIQSELAKGSMGSRLMLISLHADRNTNKEMTGSTVNCHPGDIEDKKLAEAITASVEQTSKSKITPKLREEDGYIVRETGRGIPGVLVEYEYISGKDNANLEDKKFKESYNKGIVQGIINYFSRLVVHDKPAEIKPAPAVRQEPKKIVNIKTVSDIAGAVKMTESFIKQIMLYEGKRTTIGDDVGNQAIGYGHNLTPEEIKNRTYEGRTLDDSEIYTIMANDLNKAKAPVIGFSNINFRQKQALIDYVYNKGPERLTADLKDAIEKNDFDTAASLINVNYWGKSPKNKLLGLSQRRLWDIYMFTEGKPGPKTLAAIKQLYKDGLECGKKENQNENVMKEYKDKVKNWFKGYKLQ